MFIEIYHNGTYVTRYEVDIPVTDFSNKGHAIRKFIIERALSKLKKAYPYADFALSFESRMHKIEETEITK